MGGKDLESCLHPFVESLEHGNGESVFHLGELCLVEYGVAGIDVVGIGVVICIGIVVLGRLVCLIDMVVVVEVKGMYEACHRHILFLHRCGNGVLHGLSSEQAVHSCLVVHLYACGVGSCHVALWLLAHYCSPIGTSLWRFLLLAF